jgi:hypothetical protein
MAELDNSPEHEPSLSAQRILALGQDASWSINGIDGVWMMVVLAVFGLSTFLEVNPPAICASQISPQL